MQVQHQMVNTSFTIQKEVPVNQFFSRNNQKQRKIWSLETTKANLSQLLHQRKQQPKQLHTDSPFQVTKTYK